MVVIDLDCFGVVPEEEAIVTCEPNKWVAALQVVVGHCGFLVDGHGFEGLKAVDEGFALVGVDLIEHLQVLLRGRESHRVDVVAVFLEQQGFLEQAVHDELGLRASDHDLAIPGLQQVGSSPEDLLGLLKFLHVGGSHKHALLGTQQQTRWEFIVCDCVLLALGLFDCLHI